MTTSIEAAKQYIPRFLQGFPPDKMVAVVFNTTGRVVDIKHASKAGVEQAFKGIAASGGTDHSAGVRAAAAAIRKPAPDEDVVMLWIGDGGEGQVNGFVESVRRSGLEPLAFGWLHLPGDNLHAISNAAAALGIPCFKIDEEIFADPYAIPRTMRALIAATPVGKAVTTQAVPRVSLVDEILKTELLRRPAWASPVLPAPKAAATAV
jgi:hypothetical protein